MFLFMSLFILLFSLYSVDSQLVQVTGMIFFIFAGAIAFFKAKGKNKI